MESATNLTTASPRSTFSFPLLALGKIPPPPPEVLLAALSYGRAMNHNRENEIGSPSGSFSSNTHTISDEKSVGVEFWFRWLMQQSNVFTESQTMAQIHPLTPLLIFLIGFI
ncbi:unnamed protein product [Echinostoma caproni]|uniref:Ovule protein n=1 Tax=Echinostoma caproni TaxID=27848 RepID=A0A183AH94_9TREM|nr:unnamed protein product [Echinostoma caproni]